MLGYVHLLIRPSMEINTIWEPIIEKTKSNSSFLNALFDQQTFKMISQVESFLCPDMQGTPEEVRRIQRPKRCVSTYPNKDGKKNYNQNNTHQTSSQKFRLVDFYWDLHLYSCTNLRLLKECQELTFSSSAIFI